MPLGGRKSEGTSLGRARVHQRAIKHDNDYATAVTLIPSASNMRIMRARGAPNANRTVVSLCFFIACDNMRLATVAQTTNSVMAVITENTARNCGTATAIPPRSEER